MSELPLDPEASAQRVINSLTMEDRVRDVCPGCGQHIFETAVKRLAWIKTGGPAKCKFCNIEKGK